MKRFKGILATAMAGVMLFSMVGCGGGTTEEGAGENTQETAGITTAAEGKLIWATNAAFPPYEYYEGENVVGIDADIAQCVAEKLGLEAQCEDMEFDSIIVAVSSGKADLGLAGMTITEERMQNVNFSTPYVDASQVVIVRFDSPIKAANEIAGKKVGVQLGTTGDLYVSENYSDTTVERYNKGFEAVEALLQNKIDAVVIDGDTAEEFVAANTDDDLVILEEALTEEQYAIAVAKENTALLDAVNEALAEMEESGKLDEIKAKYQDDTEETTEDASVEAETAAEETTAA